MTFLKSMVIRYLKESIDKIQKGDCELTDDEAMEILSVIAHQAVSKDEACDIVNLNKSQFGKLMSEGKLPKGKKRKGWTELRWFKDELIKSIYNAHRKS